VEQLQSQDQRPPHIWGNICEFHHEEKFILFLISVGYEQTETKLYPRKGPSQISEAPKPSNLQMGNCL
jgi:hypothetical protein